MIRTDPLTIVRALFDASRPEQVALMALVYAFGGFVAVSVGGTLSPATFALSFVAFVPTAVTVHYANEYADYETDSRANRTPFSGGSGALVRTGLPPLFLRRAMLLSSIVGVLAAVAALGAHVLPLSAFLILLTIGIVGVQYSLPPLELVWNGYGEVTNTILGGVLLPAYGFTVVTESVPVTATLVFVPFAVLVFANLLTTHWADRKPDASVGKETLAVRWDSHRLRRAYWLSVFVAYATLVFLGVGGIVPWVVVGAGLFAVPLSVWGGVRYTRVRSPFPAVAAMVVFAAAQTVVWLWVSLARA
ncbi:prenyltransferase [Halogeometricum borinquense]|uniref:Prenyltransferase n=1 Tax=Halogeometricum borinquense TaxID=60847 RepID=A0A6C0UPD9_9EURY|nr:prenyltransferase [Halogeometricum borinquense]QIB74818.1 prenyltransferase [Halogeometricum borinquense]QIQ76184.1 prenyltransferase [Halogeometricum borinquense]